MADMFTRNMISAHELHLLGSLLAPIIEVSWAQEELKESEQFKVNKGTYKYYVISFGAF